jgi:DNA polymerase-3 subunit gamma/tau
LVRAVLDTFPKAAIRDIRTAQDIASQADSEALPEVSEEWDPFEED